MQRAVDVVFGRYLENNPYYLNPSMVKRVFIDDESENIEEDYYSIIKENLSLILDSPRFEITEDITNIFNGVIALIESNDPNLGDKLHEFLSTTIYFNYGIYFIIRQDEVGQSPTEVSRSYIIKRRSIKEDSTLSVDFGTVNVFDTLESANLNAMTMEAIISRRISLDSYLYDLVDLERMEGEYDLYLQTNETYLMDTTRMRNVFENLGYKFLLVMNPTVEY